MSEELVPMTSWNDDEGLMDELGRAAGQARGVSEHHRRAAYGAFAWRTIDGELLALTHDSLVAGLMAVRGEEDARTLSFSGGGLSLELELEGTALTGQVLRTAGTSEVTMERADGESRTARTDASGFFTLPDAAGTVRFSVDVDGEVRRTEWTVL
jgi:hypothetical protein